MAAVASELYGAEFEKQVRGVLASLRFQGNLQPLRECDLRPHKYLPGASGVSRHTPPCVRDRWLIREERVVVIGTSSQSPFTLDGEVFFVLLPALVRPALCDLTAAPFAWLTVEAGVSVPLGGGSTLVCALRFGEAEGVRLGGAHERAGGAASRDERRGVSPGVLSRVQRDQAGA